MNKFVQELTSGAGSAYTQNGAPSLATSGSSCLDYFYKCGSYRNRDQQEVDSDMSRIFAEDSSLALKIVFYNRLVSRKVKGYNHESDTVQKGQGNKDEFVKSIKWLENNHPQVLYSNLWVLPLVGRWSDLWYDSPVTKFYHYTNTDKVYSLVAKGMTSEYHRGLIAKYLPQIRSKGKVTNDRQRRLNAWAKGLCQHLGWTERDYRKFKASPNNTAHLWQRQMCAGDWEGIDFNAISGKALFKLVNGKAIERHGLQAKALEWVESQPTVKFTGYPYELYKSAKVGGNVLQRHTYDKQFDYLVEQASDKVNPELLKKGVFCALDTSGSMCETVDSNGTQAVDVCVSLGIFFSSLMQGSFKDHVMMFDEKSRILKLKGSFTQKVDQIKHQSIAWGSTNFQSVIDEIVRVRLSNPSIPVEDYPEVLLVVSDMQFNPVERNSVWGGYKHINPQTNYEVAMQKLAAVGLPKMTIIWWQVNGQYGKDVPNKMDDEGVVLISGFDPTIVGLILGATDKVDEKTGEVRKATPYEVMVDALNQEILDKLQA